MSKYLENAKLELQKLGESILNEIPVNQPNDPIEGLKSKVENLQSFLEIFPQRATDKSNDLLNKFKAEFGEEASEDFREKLISLSQSIIFDFRDRILKGDK